MNEDIVDDDRVVSLADAFMSRRRGMFPAAGSPAHAATDSVSADSNQTTTAKTALAPPSSHTAPAAKRLAQEIAGNDSPLVMHTTQPSLPSIDPDLPVLNEVIASDVAKNPMFAGIEPGLINILVIELSRSVGRHLKEELPKILANASLGSLEADLQLGIEGATEIAAREFITRRRRFMQKN